MFYPFCMHRTWTIRTAINSTPLQLHIQRTGVNCPRQAAFRASFSSN
jgi:hypothetical protein